MAMAWDSMMVSLAASVWVPTLAAATAGSDGAGGGPSDLSVGVAVADITPPQGWRMSGYFHERINTGTHDPLLAKAMVFAQGQERAALVICDLLYLSREVSDRARGTAAERTGIPAANIAIAATHSHTGPLYSGPLRNLFHRQAVERHGSDPHEPIDYAAMLVERLAEVIAEAQSALRPVRLEAGAVREERLSFNRRFHMKDGSVRFNPGQQNPDIVRPAGPIDPDVGLLVVRDAASGEPSAALTVFALHLDTTGGTEYSADYPFYLEQRLREAHGQRFVSFFGPGTCGDINHIDVSIRGRRGAEEIGTMLAETVLEGMGKAEPLTRPSLAVRSRTLDLPMHRFEPERIAWARENLPRVGTGELSFLDQVEASRIVDIQDRGGRVLPVEVQVFRLSADVAVVTLPGEVFVDLGLAIKRASPFAKTLVISLTNDGPGYLPTEKAFAEGSYETVNSRIAPGGGEKMVEVAIELLESLSMSSSE